MADINDKMDEPMDSPQLGYNTEVNRRDWPTRKLSLNDPAQDDDPTVAAMTPSQRMALVYEASRRLLAMQGLSFDEQRLPRHAMRVEKRES